MDRMPNRPSRPRRPRDERRWETSRNDSRCTSVSDDCRPKPYPYTPPRIVYVTTREVFAMTPAAEVASSWKVIVMPAWATLVTLVTMSVAPVPRGLSPALVAPAHGERFAERVTPVGIATLMLAVILAVLWLVVTA